jgi:hypothetical protein
LIYSAVSRTLTRGLLSQSHDNEAAGPLTQDPEPSAARLGPRASGL